MNLQIFLTSFTCRASYPGCRSTSVYPHLQGGVRCTQCTLLYGGGRCTPVYLHIYGGGRYTSVCPQIRGFVGAPQYVCPHIRGWQVHPSVPHIRGVVCVPHCTCNISPMVISLCSPGYMGGQDMFVHLRNPLWKEGQVYRSLPCPPVIYPL